MNPTSPSPLGVLLAAAITAAGVLLAAVVGNYLVQRWQRRNWFEQQRQLFHQQELIDLRKLFDSLTSLADARLHAMRSLVAALADAPARPIDPALEDYRRQLAAWNGSLRSHYPLITLHFGYDTTLELEGDVHAGFVAAGRALEKAVRRAQEGKAADRRELASISDKLNDQAGRLSNFYKKLFDGLARRRSEILHGRRYSYLSGQLDQFTTGDLIKALFTSDIDGFDVVRPA